MIDGISKKEIERGGDLLIQSDAPTHLEKDLIRNMKEKKKRNHKEVMGNKEELQNMFQKLEHKYLERCQLEFIIYIFSFFPP